MVSRRAIRQRRPNRCHQPRIFDLQPLKAAIRIPAPTSTRIPVPTLDDPHLDRGRVRVAVLGWIDTHRILRLAFSIVVHPGRVRDLTPRDLHHEILKDVSALTLQSELPHSLKTIFTTLMK
jgi:hypothetical protein